jgi:hypothetical protein
MQLLWEMLSVIQAVFNQSNHQDFDGVETILMVQNS